MSFEKKSARKPSADPAQEKLRQHKQHWNENVSELISDLISLKRGLNGRGDPDGGIPPSSIKDPLPSSVGDKLREVASKYSLIVSDVGSIVSEQSEYSRTRRKSKPKAQPLAADDGFISEASWAGSRFWASVPWLGSLRNEAKVNREVRLKLIKFCLSIIKMTKGLDEVILSSKHQSAMLAVSNLATFQSEYQMLFVEVFEKYLALKKLKVVKKKEEENKKDSKPADSENQTEQNVPDEEAADEEAAEGREDEEDRPLVVPPPDPIPVTNDGWSEWETVHKDLDSASAVVNYLVGLDTVDSISKGVLKKLFRKLHAASVSFGVSSRMPGIKDALKMEEMAKDIISQYNQIKSIADGILGVAPNFKAHVEKLPKNVVGLKDLANFLHADEELTKLATNALSQWFKKMRLSYNSTNEDFIKLEILDRSKSLRGKVDDLLNVLENGNSSIDDLGSTISGVNLELSRLAAGVKTLGRRYMSNIPQMKNDNKSPALLAANILNQLNDLISSATKYSNISLEKESNG